MKMLDARRLTGLNVISQRPGAVVDVAVAAHDEIERIIAVWCERVEAMLEAVGWQEQVTAAHRLSGGVALVVSAPVDGLYAAVELAEWAYAATANQIAGEPVKDFQLHAERLRSLIQEEKNPALLALATAAAQHQVAFLSDDDDVSVGLGRGSHTWPVKAIPAQIDWTDIHNIPVGLVTGTNGKTTTVRVASFILRAAGLKVGISSTDWIGIDDQIIERGDYSGPGGARTAVRQRTADIAILETARGGLLRRGLGVPRADAAVITNIAEDHLGDFGSQNLSELRDLKWIVMRALDEQSVAVLNADDEWLVEKSSELTKPRIIWFAFDSSNPVMRAHMDNGGAAVAVVNNTIARFDGAIWYSLCAVSDVPITLNGAARYNVANALAAVALCHALGADDEAIVTGLTTMTAADNPGRSNIFHVNGRDVLLDFAHNPNALAGIFEVARNHPARRRVLCFGQAGDRPDELIRELARGAWAIGLDRVIISELAEHRRGRRAGEVYTLLRDELVSAGASYEQIAHHELESESLKEALAWAQRGDLIIMIGLADSRGLREYLQSRQDSSA